MPLDKFNFAQVRERMLQVKKEMPLILANQAKNDFVGNFDRQGFDGENWGEVQRRIPDTPAYKYPKDKDPGRHTRNILQGKGSGRLRKDVANSVESGYPIEGGYVGIVKNEYGQYHNTGTDKLPKRQFVGFTPTLVKAMRDKLTTALNDIWKK